MTPAPDRSAKRTLSAEGLAPRKGLGQHFLTNPQILDKIVASSELSPQDTVLEIGPGLGHLTRVLARRARRVVAVELDQELAHRLQAALPNEGIENVSVVQGDILDLDPAEAAGVGDSESGYKVVANLPYYITSAVLRHLLTARYKPERVVVTVQREVAQRMAAAPPNMSLLSLSVQYFAHVKIGGVIPAGAFYPPPKIDSAWVTLELHEPSPFSHVEEKAVFRVARAGFGNPRKQLKNTLAHGLGKPAGEVLKALLRAGVAPERRAETLSVEEWVRLAGELDA